MDSDTTITLYVECVKNNGDELSLNFYEAADNITLSWLKSDWLSAASPVLGIASVTSAKYLYSNEVELN